MLLTGLMYVMIVILPLACFLAPAVNGCDCGICRFKKRVGINPYK